MSCYGHDIAADMKIH